MELAERLYLRVGAGEAGDIGNKDVGARVALDGNGLGAQRIATKGRPEANDAAAEKVVANGMRFNG